jgi:hypothetical protein
MFDTARIRAHAVTEAAGYAGRIGVCLGFTVPSMTGEGPLIGDVGAGEAFYVHFEDSDEGGWFAPDLIERVEDDFRAVSFSVGHVTVARTADGSWQERPVGLLARLIARLRRGKRVL